MNSLPNHGRQNHMISGLLHLPGMVYVSSLMKAVKFPLSLHIALTAMAGYLLSNSTSMVFAFLIFFAVFFLSCGAALQNNIWDSDFDLCFHRTKHRDIATGKMKKSHAILVSFLLYGTGFLILFQYNRPLPVILGLMSVCFYNLIYTPMKKKSTAAIIPGVVCGILPPFIGYTAAGSVFPTPSVLVLSLIIGLWQIPHYFMIIYNNREDIKNQLYPSLIKVIPEDRFRILMILWVSLYSSGLLMFHLTDTFTSVSGYLVTLINAVFLPLFILYELFYSHKNNCRNSFILMNISILFVVLIIILENIR